MDTSHVKIRLGRLLAEQTAVESLLFDLADQLDRGNACSRQGASLKLLGSELAVRATEEAVQLHGWRGIDNAYDTQKRFRDARQTTIFEGTTEIQAMNLCREFVASVRAESLI